jgi:hypothetical protein
MGQLYRKDFSLGWYPSADSTNCPKNALLRMDNCVLDETGVVSVRPGSSKINSTALDDLDVHSLYTTYLSGTRYRMVGAGADVYSNGSSLSQTMAGTGDVAFGSGMGQIFFARSTTKKKYDGTTVYNWGIAQPNAAPTVSSNTSDSKTFSTCATADYANWAENEGTKSDKTTYIELVTSATTGRGTITKTFSSATDYTAYDGGATGADTDLFQFHFLVTEPQLLEGFQVLVDVNSGDFTTDYYVYKWNRDAANIAASAYFAPPPTYEQFSAIFEAAAASTSIAQQYESVMAAYEDMLAQYEAQRPAGIKSDLSSSEFNIMGIARSAFARVGATTGKNWSTVKAIRLTVSGTTSITTGFKTIALYGGTKRPITGTYRYKYVFVRNASGYYAKSQPSAASSIIDLKNQSVAVVVPEAALTAMDTQVNQIWVYRTGGLLNNWYRVATSTDVTHPVSIADEMSDVEAMIINEKLEVNNGLPPDDVIGIEGMHYDRIFALTSDGYLYPSRKLNPDSFDSGQVIRVCGSDETPYWVTKLGQELYIGTSKDIYRLSGTGAELDDGTIDFTKIPLGIGTAPISAATAKEGNSLCYLASDGWRAFTGLASEPLRGATDLLWRGYTRHGVSPINISSATARFRGAISKGVLTSIVPEGSSTTSSTVLYRYDFNRQRHYRHSYASSWRSLYREPDGTLIAGDSAGYVWILDTGTQDDSTDIAVVVWTGVDDNDQPYNRKDPMMHRVRCDTGGDELTVALHLDGSSLPDTSVAMSETGMGITETDCSGVTAFKQIQHRLTGSFSTFKLMDIWMDYKDRPVGRTVWDIDIDTGTQALTWIRQIRIKVLAGGDLTVTPYFDGTARTAYTASPASTVDPVIITVPIGREYKGYTPRIKVTSAYEFLPYWVEIRYRGTGNVTGKKVQRVSA